MTILAVATVAACIWLAYDSGWTLPGAFWCGVGAVASWLHQMGSAI